VTWCAPRRVQEPREFARRFQRADCTAPDSLAWWTRPAPKTEQGDCDYPAFCQRDSESASTGTCAARPVVGEPCGQRHNLGNYCQSDSVDAGSRYVSCSRYVTGETGECYFSSPRLDERCFGSCEDGAYCDEPEYGAGGTCRAGGALGASCEYDDPWGSECLRGLYCKYLGADGGYGSQCRPLEAVGNACSYSGCVADARCVDQLCVPLGTTGAACAYSSDCASTHFCGEQETCVERGARGETCSGYDSCLAGMSCSIGVCMGSGPRGALCSYSSDCLSGLGCLDGVCVEAECEEKVSSSCADQGWLPTWLFFGVLLPLQTLRTRRRRA
jgi:hypothetical protein